jgi:uncharacterized protein DUF4350
MSYRVEIGFAALLGLALAVALLAGRRQRSVIQGWEPVSTYRTGPMGGQAAYDVLARLGVPVERRRTSLFDLGRQARRRIGVLAVVSPEQWLTAAEREAVARFVAAGGEVVAVADGGGLTRCFGWDTAEPDSADLDRKQDSAAVVAPPGAGRLPPVGWVLHPYGLDSLEGITKRTAELRKKGGLARLSPNDDMCRAAVRAGVDTLLATAHGAPVVLRLRFRGRGRVVLVSEDGYFRNAAWRSSDVPELLVPLLTPRTRGRVSWDEYHHGYGERGSMGRVLVGWMAASPIGWALFQLTAVALLILAVHAVRFGPARAVIERRRRSPLEHVEALAAGLEGAAGVDAAVQLTVSGLRRRLSRTGQPQRGDPTQWLAALELALSGVRGRQAARRLQETLTKPGGAERVLAAAQAVEDVWEELRPRATPAASWTR